MLQEFFAQFFRIANITFPIMEFRISLWQLFLGLTVMGLSLDFLFRMLGGKH